MQHLCDVRTRHLHALSKLRLRHPQLLHPPQYPPQKRRSNFINRLHSLQPTFSASSISPAHTSHISPPPALIQPSPSPDLILSSTSAIQSSLSLLPSLHPITPPKQIQSFHQDCAHVFPPVKASLLCCYDCAKAARLALRNNKWEFVSRPILRQHGIGRMAVHVAKSSRDYIIRRHCQKLVIEISI